MPPDLSRSWIYKCCSFHPASGPVSLNNWCNARNNPVENSGISYGILLPLLHVAWQHVCTCSKKAKFSVGKELCQVRWPLSLKQMSDRNRWGTVPGLGQATNKPFFMHSCPPPPSTGLKCSVCALPGLVHIAVLNGYEDQCNCTMHSPVLSIYCVCMGQFVKTTEP